MQKATIFLVITGSFIVAGLGLSVWGNQIIFEDLAKSEGSIQPGQKISVQKTIQQESTDKPDSGIFAIGVLEFQKNTIHATITDPFGNQLTQKTIDRESYEGYFDVQNTGNYTLTIENTGQTNVQITGYLGVQPDAAKRTIAFISIYVLIIGLVGFVVAIIYSAVQRKKS